MKIFKKIKAYFQYRNAVLKADQCHARDGRVYYVLPGIDGKLLVTNRQDFKLLKKYGYISKSRTMIDVQKGCFYRTSGPTLDPLSPEHLAFRKSKFYEWLGV